MKEKLKELKEIEREINEKISEELRTEITTRMVSRIISIISKYLIRTMGYSAATTILQREFRNMGKESAKEFINLFNLKRKNHKDAWNDNAVASRALKIAALFLGLKLDGLGNETIVKNCPQGMQAIKLREPLLCNICLEYNNGVLLEMLGEDYVLERIKWIFSNDEYCMFRIKEKNHF
ncbi:MAG: hypothetical protein QW412_01440 [Candidatus Aenigmatarchaeota archaeon]